MHQISAEAQRAERDIAEVAAVAEQSSASAEQVSASTQQTGASTQEIAASAKELAATARGDIARRGMAGGGMAKTALILGIIGIVLNIASMVAGAVIVSSS